MVHTSVLNPIETHWVVLDHLVRVFEPGVRYPEREVNALLAVWHPDTAALRRYLVDDTPFAVRLLAESARRGRDGGGPADRRP